MKLPFGWLPGHWGLRGKTREIAKAEYELEGMARDKRIAELEFANDAKLLAARLRQIDLDYNLITPKEFDIAEAKATLTGVDLELQLLKIEYETSEDMTAVSYDKAVATIKGEPYIAVVDSQYDADQEVNGFYFEFDWNDKWIELLKENGYTGITDDQIVQRWFEDLCRGVIAETMVDDTIPFNSGRIINRMPRDDGNVSYT